MVPDINWFAVVAATLSTMVVGTVWYMPKVFGTRWMELIRTPQEELSQSGLGPILITVVVSFISASVLAGATDIAHAFYGGSFLVSALVTSVFLWAGFTAARVITHDAFENRPRTLTLLTIGHELVTVVVMALVIGVWPPA